MGTGAKRYVVIASDISPTYVTGRVEGVGNFALKREPGDEANVARLKLNTMRYVLVHATAGRYSQKSPSALGDAILADIANDNLQLAAFFLNAFAAERLIDTELEFGKWKKDMHRYAFVILDTESVSKKDKKVYKNLDLEPYMALDTILTVTVSTALIEYGNNKAKTPPYPVRTALEIFEMLGDRKPQWGLTETAQNAAPAAGPVDLSVDDSDIRL